MGTLLVMALGGLYRAGLDGNGEELVTALWTGNGSNFKWMIHRGYLYQTGNYYVVEDEQDKLNLKIARKSLKKDAVDEVLIEIPDMRALDNWLIQDNKLFLDVSYGSWGKRKFYMYDLEKGELNEQGTTIILSSHYAEDIEVLCDTVCEMDAGILTILS